MIETRLRVGVVGVGRMGQHHLNKYREIPEADVVGFFDANAERCQEIAQRFGVRAYSNLPDLLFDADAISIASPTPTHYPIARQSLESGVHVLVEKPIAETVEEADDLVRIARERGLVLQVGFLERFRFAALTRDISLSRVGFIDGNRLSPSLGREESSDVVTDLMIHDLDLVLSLIQEEPVHVSAIGMPVLTSNVDIANVRLEFPGGAVVNLNASRVAARPYRRFRIFASDVFASLDFISNAVELVSRGSSEGLLRRALEPASLDPLREQCAHFLRCIREKRQPLVSGVCGARALKYARLVREKIHERSVWAPSPPSRPESFPEPPVMV